VAGRNPNAAFQQFIDPLRSALNCVTQERLTASRQHTYEVGTIYSVLLNDLNPVRLRTAAGILPVYMSVGQQVRIIKTEEPADPRGPYKIQIVEYFYDLRSDDHTELLTFHWTPEAEGDGVVTFPHLHAGSAIIAQDAPIRPRDFHKIHIPTGRVSVEAIIRLAITEFGAIPLKRNWVDELNRTEAAFLNWRTRIS